MQEPRTALITGANSGIGLATARALAQQNWTVLLVCRTEGKAEATRDQLIRETRNTNLFAYSADLSSQTQLRRMAAQVLAQHDRLDVLINNAGVWNSKLEYTVDGVETVFAVNHLAYFLLTHLLLPILKEAPEGRIINVSSDSHFQLKGMAFDDLYLTRRYHGLRSYAQSKLANLLFTYEFERRNPAANLSIHAVQPGLVQTDIGLKHTNWLHAFAWRVRRQMRGRKSPEEGAKTSIFLATTDDLKGRSGLYWDDCAPKPSSKASQDLAAAQQLWEISCERSHITDYFSA